MLSSFLVHCLRAQWQADTELHFGKRVAIHSKIGMCQHAKSVSRVQVIDFYEYYEGLQEGWDGPALLVFSDGNKIGARLDRNGLRPARYWETDDGMVYVASEVGVLGDVLTNASHVVRKGRLGPGQMVCADLHEVSHISLSNSCILHLCKKHQTLRKTG